MSTPRREGQIEDSRQALIDDALRSYGAVRAPRTLRPAVMARVRATPQAAPAQPPPQLEWLDVALGLLAVGMAGLLVLGAWLALPALTGPEVERIVVVATAELQARAPALSLSSLRLAAIASAVAAATVVALVGALWTEGQPRPQRI